MAKEIAIAFDPNGTIEYTRAKELDWLFGGDGEMRRVTDIGKTPNESLFFIRWLLGPFSDVHGHVQHVEVFGNRMPTIPDGFIDQTSQTIFFRSYEAAVIYEITCLNAMREQGHTFGV